MCDNSSNGHGSDSDAGAAARGAGQGSSLSAIFGRPTDRTTPPGRNGHRIGLARLLTLDVARRLAARGIA